MLFDISDLPPEGVPVDHDIVVPEFEWEGGGPIVCTGAHLDGRLRTTSRGVELHGRYAATVRLTCSRCLGPFESPVGADFRLFLIPTGPDVEERPFETVADDDPDAVDLYPLEGTVVDLAAVLREQIDLALPYRALCREDCSGLCSRCGADLNAGPCGCAPQVDERWKELRTIRGMLERKKGREPEEGS